MKETQLEKDRETMREERGLQEVCISWYNTSFGSESCAQLFGNFFLIPQICLPTNHKYSMREKSGQEQVE